MKSNQVEDSKTNDSVKQQEITEDKSNKPNEPAVNVGENKQSSDQKSTTEKSEEVDKEIKNNEVKRMKQEIKSLENKVIKEIDLDKTIFGVEVKSEIIHRMVRYQLAKKRSGNHKTKGISEISGTTRKPFKQKGYR